MQWKCKTFSTTSSHPFNSPLSPRYHRKKQNIPTLNSPNSKKGLLTIISTQRQTDIWKNMKSVVWKVTGGQRFTLSQWHKLSSEGGSVPTGTVEKVSLNMLPCEHNVLPRRRNDGSKEFREWSVCTLALEPWLWHFPRHYLVLGVFPRRGRNAE